MLQYILVVTNENEDIRDNFIHSISFHQSYEDAEKDGKEVIKDLKGMSDFYIYRNLDWNTELFLRENESELLPFK